MFNSGSILPIDALYPPTLGAGASEIGDIQAYEQPGAGSRLAEMAHASRLLTLGEYTASISHELNQPLAAIVTNVEACIRWLDRDDPQPDRVRASLNAVLRNALRSAAVVDRLRSLSRKSDTQRVALNVNEIIHEAISLLDPEIKHHGIDLQLRLNPSLPPAIGDQVQLLQVLINLIANAIQAMATVKNGSRTLTIRAQLHEPTHASVSVEDTGPGIPPENHDLLFTPFFTTKSDGVGLGLAICRSIIEAHDGRIWATANKRRGATFSITLPTEVGKTA